MSAPYEQRKPVLQILQQELRWTEIKSQEEGRHTAQKQQALGECPAVGCKISRTMSRLRNLEAFLGLGAR